MWTCLVVFADVMVEDVPHDVVAVATVGEPRVVDLVDTAKGFVAMVSLEVIGLMVAEVALGVTLVVTGTLGVVRRVVVDVEVGVAPDVTGWVMTLSITAVTFGAVAEVVVCTRGKDRDDIVVDLVVTCTLSVTGCFGSVIG